MSKVIVFAGSNSSRSINKQLAQYAASHLSDIAYEVLDLNDYPLPVFGVDLEERAGYPDAALAFDQKIQACSGIILSLAENNGSYSAVFKNLLDWLSRIEGKCFRGRPMLLLSTSPGARGGASVMEAALNRFPRHDANIIAHFSLPSFKDNFSEGMIVHTDLNQTLIDKVKKFEEAV